MAIVKPVILEGGQLKTAGVGDQVPQSYVQGLDTLLETKVDKVSGKTLSDTNFTQAEKTKLSGVAVGATKNRADSGNADKLHTHAINDITGLSARLNDIDALINEAATNIAIIDDTAGAGDTEVTWSADKSSRELADIGSMIGDVEYALIVINGEP